MYDKANVLAEMIEDELSSNYKKMKCEFTNEVHRQVKKVMNKQ